MRRVVVLIGVVVAACSSPPKARQQPPGQDGSVVVQPTVDGAVIVTPVGSSLKLATSLEAAMQGMTESRYMLYEQRDIVAIASVPAAAGVFMARLDIKPPQGDIYQTIWRAFSSDPSAPQTVPHPMMGEALDVERVTAAAGLATVYIGIPVAGTDLTRFGRTGTFVVDLVDASTSTTIATSSFELVGE